MQQSLARLLGLLDYTSHSHALPEAIDCLVASVTSSVKDTEKCCCRTNSDHFHQSELRMSDVGARKNCLVSIRHILTGFATRPSRGM